MKLKIVLVGSNAVGKTSIANRYTRNLFSNRYINTIGCDFYIKTLDFRGEECKLIIHDIGGQLEFREFRKKYMDNADMVLVIFDLNDRTTFEIGDYVNDVLTLPVKATWAIVGNKMDLVDKDKVDLSTINAFVEKYKVPLYFTSAKENTNIQEVFLDLVKRCVDAKA
ncbi:MAG: GTP-binding protein [Candidatus Sigynarchaeum springense]